MKSKKVIIVGSGFGGLASACIFAEAGFDVTLFEKNKRFGGRAGLVEVKKNNKGTWAEIDPSNKTSKARPGNVFRFDSGPSWYLMPDIFEHFFTLINEDANKQLELKRLNPSYQVLFKDTLVGPTKIYGDIKKDGQTLDAFEPQADYKLSNYLESASYRYETAISKFLYKNYDSIFDFFTPQMMSEGIKLNVLSNMQKYVSKYFTSKEIQKILQYPLVFLGASPKNAPALYSLMSHVDFKQGVFYPMGGIYRVTQTLVKLAKKRKVTMQSNAVVEKIIVKQGRATGVVANGKEYKADIVISNADIEFTESNLLEKEYRTYSKHYWKKRVMAPSALILYLGVKGSYDQLEHHNLVFSRDWDKNFSEIFKSKKFPADPSFYVCNPNKTDPTVAPKGHENLFVLVPIGADAKYTPEKLDEYSEKILETMETTMHLSDLRKRIVYKKLICVKDFKADYNSYQGSALGLAHTLKQTAVFRPRNQHKKIPNLLFVGANTTPGIGLPMCLISAELAYKRTIDDQTSGPLEKI